MVEIKELIRDLEIGTVIRDKETPWNYDYCWLDFCDFYDSSSVSVYGHSQSAGKSDGSESKIHWNATLPRGLIDKALQELVEKEQSQLTAEVEVGESYYHKANGGIDEGEQRYRADITINMKLVERKPELKVSKHRRHKQYVISQKAENLGPGCAEASSRYVNY